MNYGFLSKIIIILAIIGAGFFCGQKIWASQSILISEVQITGGAGKTSNDFIELYNPNSSSFNLKGYRLVKRTKTGMTDTSIKSWTADIFIPANGYYLWANSGYTDIVATANATTTATISDDNGIAIRFGAADTGAIIDSLAWGQAQNVFIEGAVFPTNPGANQSLERKSNLDTNNNSADFFIEDYPNPQSSGIVAPPPTAQCGNGQTETGEGCDDGNLVSGDGCGSTCQTETATTTPAQNETASSTSAAENPPSPLYQGGTRTNFGEVVINEFVSDPADNEVEWLELYNKTDREIDLSGWWLEDGSKTKTDLVGSLGASGSDRYKIIEKPAGILNNDGDLIVLYDATGKIIDQVAYGNWNDGYLADNAPVARDPASVARKFDGYNTFNNANDFAMTIRPTKGTSNLIQTEDEVSAEAKAKFDFSNDIHITEILPNPTGDDTKLEFIEIYNAGAREVNLTGWSLGNEDGKKKNLEDIATSTIIKAGEYLAVFRLRSKIVLHNDSGEARLYEPLAERAAQTVKYKNVKEGWSYNMEDHPNPLNPPLSGGKISGEWVWSETPTPGAANLIKAVNYAPEADFSFKSPALVGVPVIFDSSDTADQDGDRLICLWDFGDGFKNNLANPEHTFLSSGIYQVKLSVSDGQATSTQGKSVKVVNSVREIGVNAETPLTPLLKGGEIPLNPPLLKGVIINEVFPNPQGADTGSEWAELKNQGADKINLINWRLENQNGKYKFKDDLWLDAENFYLLTNAASQLAFKNQSDVISLYNDLDELVDRVEYTEAVQGEAYARGENGKWFWTTKLTPGQENIISLANSQSVAVSKSGIIPLRQASGRQVNNESGIMGNAENYLETDLEKVRDMEIGSLVKVKGTVAVEPGILGAQIFYIVGSPGIQIYNYKKDFPALKVGDYIEVSGELAQTQDEFRIKTKDKNDINIVERKPAPPALALSCDALSEENIGQLITLTGEITDKKASTAYLDDGSNEILVYFKKSAGLDTKNLKVGQAVAVTGILSKTQTGLRLLPRYQADIVNVDQAVVAPQVLGEAIQASEWAVAERDKKLELFKYLLIIAVGAIIVLAGLFIRIKKKNVA